jgi:predicted DNA-binding protein
MKAGRKPIDASKKKKTHSISLKDELWARIQHQSESEGRTVSNFLSRWAETLPKVK